MSLFSVNRRRGGGVPQVRRGIDSQPLWPTSFQKGGHGASERQLYSGSELEFGGNVDPKKQGRKELQVADDMVGKHGVR